MAQGRLAHFEFIAILDGARVDGALDGARAEYGERGVFNALDIEVRSRAIDLGRLDEILAGRASLTLKDRPDHERWAVDRCNWYASIAAMIADPVSLDVLQAAIGTLRALAEEGDLLFGIDVATARFWTPAELLALAPDRHFALDEHVRVVVEAVERSPGVGHVVRSRGLAKFARPDVAARAPRREAERISEIVRDLARLLAEGETIAPGDRLSMPMLPPMTFVPRTDDALADAPATTAPLYELRDLGEDGRPGDSCAGVLAALRPRARLKVVKR